MEQLTHENCGIKMENWSKGKKDDQINALTAYEDIGITPEEAFKIYEVFGLTPEQILELKERDTAKKRELINGGIPVCPVCGAKVFAHYVFCKDCGQRLKQRED